MNDRLYFKLRVEGALMAILQANNINMIYGGGNQYAETRALKGVNYTLEEGEFAVVMGPSGSGKSTLLNILSGFDRATSGQICMNGIQMSELKNDALSIFRRRNIGYIFQEYNLLDSLTIKENIMLPMILDNRKPIEMSKRADQLIDQFGIESIKDKYPYHVSGGQQQRTAICRALINEAKVIFADEPTGSLDSKASRNVLDCLKIANKENGISILMVTHDPFAASYSDKVSFIKDGIIKAHLYKENEKTYFQQIIDHLAVLEEDNNEI